MKISVLIPAFRCAKTIQASLESVFLQRRRPDEIVVLLDGIIDDTPARLEPYRSRIRIIEQENRGIAKTRNRLVELAQGDLFAFLDADDIWHPEYLSAQEHSLTRFPMAVAGFTGHLRFHGKDHQWSTNEISLGIPELTDPLTFFNRLNIVSAVYGSMSYCCIRRSAFASLGPEPFSNELSGPEDCYLLYQLAMQGPIAFQSSTLVAYRMMPGSLSEDKIRVLRHWVRAFELLEQRFHNHPSPELRTAFLRFYAQKRREYAKTLFGVSRYSEARIELLSALRICRTLESWSKTLGLYGASFLPSTLQPNWPSPVRKVTSGSSE
jgi:glycosyltransferase involved in cell wall biosynthesis